MAKLFRSGVDNFTKYATNDFGLKNLRTVTRQILDYEYSVFDVITELLESQGGKAKKGYGRRRLGDPGCEETTVAGAIMKNYFGKTTGESCFDPTFALVAILEWAGIVRNGWGYIELTEEYVRERIQKEG